MRVCPVAVSQACRMCLESWCSVHLGSGAATNPPVTLGTQLLPGTQNNLPASELASGRGRGLLEGSWSGPERKGFLTGEEQITPHSRSPGAGFSPEIPETAVHMAVIEYKG